MYNVSLRRLCMTLPNKTINKMYRRLCTGIFACRCPYRLCFVHISFMYNFFGIFTQKFSLKQHFYVAIFVDSLQSNFIISVSKTFISKNKGRKSLANHLFISHSSHFIGKKRKHCHSLRQLFSWSARIKAKFVL